MKWRATLEAPTLRRFEIKQDPVVGFYLYIFEGDECSHDHLQDTLEMVMECAWEAYGVSKNAWRKTEE